MVAMEVMLGHWGMGPPCVFSPLTLTLALACLYHSKSDACNLGLAGNKL